MKIKFFTLIKQASTTEFIAIAVICSNVVFSKTVLDSIGAIGIVMTCLLINISQEIRKLNKGE